MNSTPILHLIDQQSLHLKRSELYSKGVVDYVVFPIIPDELINRVFAYLAFFNEQDRLYAVNYEKRQRFKISDHKYRHLVSETCQYLINNLSEPISLMALAKTIGTNRTTLSERFKQEMGMGVMTWLRKKRLKYARQLLEKTDLNIQQVAIEVGYNNAANFSTAFKAEFGFKPKQTRHQLSFSNELLMPSKEINQYRR